MFSNTAEYALRATVYLATTGEGLRSSADIAAATKVPAKYLSKVLNDLVTAGIVLSRRGPSGGFTLARAAGTISVLEVVNAVDPIQRIRECPLGIPSHGTHLCRLHRKLDQTIALVEETLRSSSILEMTDPAKAGAEWVFPMVRAPKRGGRGKPADR